MKRKRNLYSQIYDFENILDAFNEVCRNTKNKRHVENLKEYKCVYISRIHSILKSKTYHPGPCNIFIIHEPKKRRYVKLNIKIIIF